MQEIEDENQRYIPNEIPDYTPELFNPDLNYQIIAKILTQLLKQYFQNIDSNSPIAISSSIQNNKKMIDFYDGIGGNFYLLLKLIKFAKKLQFEPNVHLLMVTQMLNLDKLITMMKDSNALIRKNKAKLQDQISFYFGYPGLLALEAEEYYLLQDQGKFSTVIEEIKAIKEQIMSEPPGSFEFEVLYGISGFLQILLNLQTQFQYNDNINTSYSIQLEDHVFSIVELILNSGLKFERNLHPDLTEQQFEEFAKKKPKFRLHYRFLKIEYLVNQKQIKIVFSKGSCAWTFRNFIYANESSINQQIRYTQLNEYFYQAMQLVITSYTDFSIQNCIKTYKHPDRLSIGSADYPFGLMNGIAGEICLLIDLFHPFTSKFPGYEV